MQNELISDQQVVYLLWHGDDVDDETPDAKLLGVYSSEEVAQDRIARSATLPGFAEHPDDFLITRYAIDEDQWTSGYVEIEFPLPSDRPNTPGRWRLSAVADRLFGARARQQAVAPTDVLFPKTIICTDDGIKSSQ